MELRQDDVTIRRLRQAAAPPVQHPATIEAQIESAVERAIERLLGPYLARLCDPEPAVYTVAQVAVVLQVSDDTVARLVKRGALPRVPHLNGKVLIPRAAVERLVEVNGAQPAPAPSPASMRSISSAASRSEPGMKCR
jgi:excisionase family DNA binding protein